MGKKKGGPPQQQQQQGGGQGGPPQQQQQQVGGQGGPPQQQQRQQQGRGRGGPPQQQQQQVGGHGGPPQQPQQQQGGGRGGPSQQQQQQVGGQGGPPQQRQQQGRGRGGPPQQQQVGGHGGPPQQPQQQQGGGRGGPPQQQQQQGGAPGGLQQSQQEQPAKGKPKQQPPQKSPAQQPSSLAPQGNGKQPGKAPANMKLLPIPARTKTGHSGRKTIVEVNQLPLNLSKICAKIHHYDVAIDPDKPRRLMRPALQLFLRKHCPTNNPAFDGRKNLYSAKELSFGTSKTDTVKVTNEERVSNNELEFTITVKLAQTIYTDTIEKFMRGELLETPQSAIQAIDVVLRTAPLAGISVPVGRSYFLPPGPRETTIDLGGGLELWYGFYQSAILNWKPYLNVDVAHKGFPKGIALPDLLLEVCQLRNFNEIRDSDIRKFKGFISTLKVDYEIPGVPNTRRTHRVNNVGTPADQLKFSPENGPEVTVAQYFVSNKNYRLRLPSLPTVQVDPVIKKIFLPMELCTLKPGQALNRKLDETQTAQMVRAAAKPPVDRKRRIMDAIHSAKYNSSPSVREFGIGVSEVLEKVDARVLDAPGVEYKNTPRPKPQPGQWRAGLFYDSKELKEWYILNLDYRTRPEKLQDFGRMIVRQGKDLGMSIENMSGFQSLSDRSPRLKMEIQNCLQEWKSKGAELVFVVLSSASDSYSQVKQIAELRIGILTQCIKSSTMFKMNPATCGNILLKVNSKTNGTNHILGRDFLPPVLARPCMFVGIDVTHPSPDQSQIPSVAAVSASHDARAFQYNMIWSLQPPRHEIIIKLKEIMITQLKVFYSKTGHKPEKIIVYRDGVSEGQFQQVLNAELTAIRSACTALQADYKPGITFLVVQKRHHIRFFPQKQEDCDGKNRNVPPGTIVDTKITHPRELDFYLVSHSSLQGTSRPTKYHRLWDDNNITEDQLEILTYYLCYLFSRCTRSVSYPAPTYYAHLAAFRARVYLENNPANVNDLNGFETRNKIEPNFMKNSPMFFV